MKKSDRVIRTFLAEEIGREEWVKIKKSLGLRQASLANTMGPHWCDLWILKFKDGRKQTWRQLSFGSNG